MGKLRIFRSRVGQWDDRRMDSENALVRLPAEWMRIAHGPKYMMWVNAIAGLCTAYEGVSGALEGRAWLALLEGMAFGSLFASWDMAHRLRKLVRD